LERQWHQLDNMQTIYTSLQTNNHINTSSLNIYRLDALPGAQSTYNKAIKKVKFSHTRYRALGPELIPVYRQSARRSHEVNHAIYLAVVCHCFLPGLRLPS